MKTKTLFLLPALIAALNLLSVGQAPAQTFTILHSFPATNTSDDGYADDGPEAGLILRNNTLYGAARSGGSSGFGTVFAVSTDGTGFMVLHNFGSFASDGVGPAAQLLLSGNTLYGTTAGGFQPYWGGSTVFAVN